MTGLEGGVGVGGGSSSSSSASTSSGSSSSTTLRPLQNTNKYVQNKSWVCTHCHFANDSLKIVCMNCRSSKQHPLGASDLTSAANKTAGAHHSMQTKRKMVTAATSKQTTTETLNRSNEENECAANGSGEKSSKISKTDNHYCKNCTDKIADTCQVKSSSSSTNTNETPTSLVTPTPQKPLSLLEMVIFGLLFCYRLLFILINLLTLKKKKVDTEKPPTTTTVTSPLSTTSSQPLSSLFGSTSSSTTPSSSGGQKWTCQTCLVQNTDDKSSCACCMTARPSSKPPSQAASAKWTCQTCLVQNTEDKSTCACCMTPKPSATAAAAPTTTASAKWKCDTCLVENAADKSECACCMTPKPGAAKTTSLDQADSVKTKFSALVAIANSNQPAPIINKSVSFGLAASSSKTFFRVL